MEAQHKIYITTPIYYPNGKPHVGTLTTTVICDFLARAHKKINYKVLFLSGLDEHGEKVFKTAKHSGQDVMTYLNDIKKTYDIVYKKYQIDCDIFYRTSSKEHKQQVEDIWNTLQKLGYIYQSTYSGLYSKSSEEFVENGTTPPLDAEMITENVYYLKLSLFENDFRDFITQHNFLIPSNKANELIGFIKNGLRDLCISRERLEWGVKVPNGIGVIYVWIDALSNYLNATKYNNLESYWSNVVHVIGKDIIIFHGIYWICMLFMLSQMPNRLRILVHNWWVVNGEKSSKSKGNIITAEELIDAYPASMVRFYLLYVNLFHQDQEFSVEKMIDNYNSLMVNKISNLFYRIEVIMKKNLMEYEFSVKETEFYTKMKSHIINLDITGYINLLIEHVDELNAFIEHHRVWEQPVQIRYIFNDLCNIYHFLQAIDPNIKPFFSGMLYQRHSTK